MEVNWGNVKSYSEVQSVNGLTGKVQLKIPTKTSDLVNDSGFVSNSNYATKAELKEVENKIPNVSGLATKVELNNAIFVGGTDTIDNYIEVDEPREEEE